MCQVLGIQRSSFYKWQAGRQARQAKQAADEAVVARVQDHHEEWDQTLGYRRMTVELNAEAPAGEPVNHKWVARLMRANGIVGVHLRKPKTTTVRDPGAQVFADLINRDFTAEATNQVYVGDVTSLPYGEKGEFLYLATVIDVCSKRLAGWSIADHMRTSLVEDALHHVAATRGSLEGAIFGSDYAEVFVKPRNLMLACGGADG